METGCVERPGFRDPRMLNSAQGVHLDDFELGVRVRAAPLIDPNNDPRLQVPTLCAGIARSSRSTRCGTSRTSTPPSRRGPTSRRRPV